MSFWSKVKPGDELPEPLEDVLLVYEFDDDRTIDMGFRRPNGEWFLTGDVIKIEPTHWMPLPALPPTDKK